MLLKSDFCLAPWSPWPKTSPHSLDFCHGGRYRMCPWALSDAPEEATLNEVGHQQGTSRVGLLLAWFICWCQVAWVFVSACQCLLVNLCVWLVRAEQRIGRWNEKAVRITVRSWRDCLFVGIVGWVGFCPGSQYPDHSDLLWHHDIYQSISVALMWVKWSGMISWLLGDSHRALVYWIGQSVPGEIRTKQSIPLIVLLADLSL